MGQWNVICDRCGGQFKSSEVSKEWTNLVVCKTCYETRQPQDFVKGIRENIAVPFARPQVAPDELSEPPFDPTL